MKISVVTVFVALIGCSVAQQQQQQRFTATQSGNEIVIVRSENENSGDGTFRWVSELSDGSKHEQSGYVKAGPDPENSIQVIQGTFSYISPEGQNIQVQYIADENGFQPTGDHLPTPPPVPEAIQKALNTINSNAANQAAPAPQQAQRQGGQQQPRQQQRPQQGQQRQQPRRP